MRTITEIANDWESVIANSRRPENSSGNSQIFYQVALEALQEELLQVRRMFRDRQEQQEPEGKMEED